MICCRILYDNPTVTLCEFHSTFDLSKRNSSHHWEKQKVTGAPLITIYEKKLARPTSFHCILQCIRSSVCVYIKLSRIFHWQNISFELFSLCYKLLHLCLGVECRALGELINWNMYTYIFFMRNKLHEKWTWWNCTLVENHLSVSGSYLFSHIISSPFVFISISIEIENRNIKKKNAPNCMQLRMRWLVANRWIALINLRNIYGTRYHGIWTLAKRIWNSGSIIAPSKINA